MNLCWSRLDRYGYGTTFPRVEDLLIMMMPPSKRLLLSLCMMSVGCCSIQRSASSFIAPLVGTTFRKSNTLQTQPLQYDRSSYHTSPWQLCGRKGGDVGNKEKKPSKSNLPEKICAVCGRPFTWRKKWERCWDEVTCCSKTCNSQRRSGK